MAYRKVILDEATREYREIVIYLAEILQSLQAAADFMDEFDCQLSLVAENPLLFGLSRMPGLAARGYRTMHVNNYVALYRVKDDMVVVAHIFHQTQNYASLV